MSAVRTDLPDIDTIWRDRYSPQRTVKVTGAVSDSGPVVCNVLTEDTGKAPVTATTAHTPLDAWDWLYEPAGLGARA